MTGIAIFDFDKTIISRDSFVEYYKYMFKRGYVDFRHLLESGIVVFRLIIGNIDAKTAKEQLLKFILLIDSRELEMTNKHFLEELMEKYAYSEFYTQLAKHHKRKEHVVVISASPTIYLKGLKELINVNCVLGTEFTINNEGAYTGCIQGKNCKGQEKVEKLLHYAYEHNIELDFEESTMYSDSLADLPLFKICKHKVLVNNNKVYPDISNARWR